MGAFHVESCLARCTRVVFLSVLFGVVITSLGEEKAGLCASPAFVWLYCTRYILSFCSSS